MSIVASTAKLSTGCLRKSQPPEDQTLSAAAQLRVLIVVVVVDDEFSFMDHPCVLDVFVVINSSVVQSMGDMTVWFSLKTNKHAVSEQVSKATVLFK